MATAATISVQRVRVAPRAINRTVWILFACQALAVTNPIVQTAVGGLVGRSLAPTAQLATLPLATQMLAAMVSCFVAVPAFEQLGRKRGFLVGAAASSVGSLLAAAAIWRGGFTLFCIAAAPAGLGLGLMQHLRFAAAEAVSNAAGPRAVALVMAGGVIAAFAGPALITHTGALLAPATFCATYLALAGLPVVIATLLLFADLPNPTRCATPLVKLRAIVTRPAFLVASAVAAAAQGGMNLYTISAPIQLVICGFGMQIGAEMALAHALAMFAPGFITGRLVERFGSAPVIVAGVALNSGCVACALSGTTVLPFLGGEVLSGLGWNLMFTGATTMLSRAHGHDERVRAQAANDVVISATLVSTSIAAGVLHSAIGWAAVIIAAALLILIGLAAVIWRLPPPMALRKLRPDG